LSIKDSQLTRLYDYREKLENDISELSWKVYSTSSLLDDLYTDNFYNSIGVDLVRSTGLYVPTSGNVRGYYRNLIAASGNIVYGFSSNNDALRKPLQSTISNWISDQVQGTTYQASTNFGTWSSGRVTIRNKINALNWVYNANAIRVQFSASSFPITIDHASIGQWLTGTDISTTTIPTPLTFNVGSPNITIPANTSIWTDWILFNIYYGTDYVLIVDLADGRIKYAATNNLGFSRHRLSASSYNVATPIESQYFGGAPSYNNYVIPTSIQYTSNWQAGHFTNGESSISVGPDGLVEVETGCLVELNSGVSRTIKSIIGNGSNTGNVVLNQYAETSQILGIYGTKYSSSTIVINSDSTTIPSQFTITKGGVGLRINTNSPRAWSHITGVTTTQSTPGASLIYHFISFDSGNIWKVYSGSAWRPVVRVLNGIWQHNNSVTSTPNWVNSNSNNDFSSLKESLTYPLNLMTGSQLASISESQWIESNGFNPSVSASIDFAFAMKSDGTYVPSLTRYTTSYSIDVSNITFITNNWDASSINPTYVYCILLLTVMDSMVPNTDLKLYVSTDNGSNYTQITNLIVLNTVGTQVYVRGELTGLTQRGTKSIRMKITTHNDKDIRIGAVSMGLRYA
jgi:hypothetical protein